MEKKLYRDTESAMIGGVCAGLAEYFGIDPTIVRLVAVVLGFAWGSSIIAYIVMWIVVPKREKSVYVTADTGGTMSDSYPPTGQPPNDPQKDPFAAQDPVSSNQDPTGGPGPAGASGPDPTGQVPPPPPPPVSPPTAPYHAPTQKRGGIYFGVFLIIVGLLALVGNFWGGVSWWSLWPVFIIAGGVVEMFTRGEDQVRWTPWRIIGGLTTILFGFVLLGCTTGVVAWSMFWRVFTLWPLLIVALGLVIIGGALKKEWISVVAWLVVVLTVVLAALSSLTGNTIFPNSKLPENVENAVEKLDNLGWWGSGDALSGSKSVPLNTFRDSKLTFNSGAGAYKVKSTSADELFIVSTRSPSELEIDDQSPSEVHGAFDVATWGIDDSTLELSRDVEWDLKLKSGAANNDYDLRNLDVSHLVIDTGASTTKLQLGRPVTSRNNLDIDTGLSSLTISVPEGTPVRIKGETGLTSYAFEGLTKQSDGSYTNKEFDDLSSASMSSKAAWDITIDGGLASFSFDFED